MSKHFAGRLGEFASGKNWCEEIAEGIGPPKKCGPSEPSAKNGKHRKDHQRSQHAPRRFMYVYLVLVKPLLAAECQENQPEHIQRRQQRGQQPKNIKDMAAPRVLAG